MFISLLKIAYLAKTKSLNFRFLKFHFRDGSVMPSILLLVIILAQVVNSERQFLSNHRLLCDYFKICGGELSNSSLVLEGSDSRRQRTATSRHFIG